MKDNEIILKCDDFWGKGDKPEKQFINLISKYQIKVSLGIIGKGFEVASPAIVNDLVQYQNYFIPFNHSFWHIVEENKKEFFKTDIEYQRQSIKMANDVILKRTGIEINTIGFPANACDNNTVDILKEFPNLKNIYYTKIAHNREYINSLGRNIIDVDFDKVLQIHPFRNDFNFEALENLIIEKLEKGFNFITP